MTHPRMIELTATEEFYALAIANGEDIATLYGKNHPKASRKTCVEKASRLASRDNIKARIEDLRLLKVQAQARVYEQKAKEAAEEFKGHLLTSFRRRQLLRREAERKGVKPTELVSILKLDAELAGEFKTVTELTGKDGTPLPSIVPEIVINYLPSHMATPRIPTKKGKE